MMSAATMTRRFHVLLCLTVLSCTSYDAVVNGFSIPPSSTTASAARRGAAASSKSLLMTTARSSSSSSSSSSSRLLLSSPSSTTDQTSSTGSSSFSYRSLFNFTNVDEKAVDKFERIDDAVRSDFERERERERERKLKYMNLVASFDAAMLSYNSHHYSYPFCRSVVYAWNDPSIHPSID